MEKKELRKLLMAFIKSAIVGTLGTAVPQLIKLLIAYGYFG